MAYVVVLVAAAVVGLAAVAQAAVGIAIATVAVFALFGWNRPAVGLAMVSFASFLALVPAPLLPAVTLFKGLAIVLIVIWLLQRGPSPRGRVPIALSLSLAFFASWTVASILWAADQPAALAAVGRYAQLVAIAIVGIAVMRRREDAVVVAGAFLAGAAAAAAMGLLTGIGTKVGRVGGTVGDANELGVALVASLALVPPLLARARARSSLTTTVMICLATATALTGLVMTGSRGGLLALVGAALVGLAMGRRWWRWAVPVLGATGAIAVLMSLGVALPGPASRLASSDASTRLPVWTVALRMVEARPATGVGVGNFVPASPRYLLRAGDVARSDLVIDTRKVAHNMYLQVAAEGGLPALLAFVAALVLAGACAVCAARRFDHSGEDNMAFLAESFAVALAGIAVASLFLSLEVNRQLWLVAAVCIGLYRISVPRGQVANKQYDRLGDLSAGRLAVAR
jgi:putative inorganic carbon (hco3(-)) transporter